MGNINNLNSEVQHSKNVEKKKTEIQNVPNVNYETQNASESLKSLLKESLDIALPFSPLFPAPLRQKPDFSV